MSYPQTNDRTDYHRRFLPVIKPYPYLVICLRDIEVTDSEQVFYSQKSSRVFSDGMGAECQWWICMFLIFFGPLPDVLCVFPKSIIIIN